MGLWLRIKRVFGASANAALDRIENPELVLQKTIRDMRERIPDLNNTVAQVMANERLQLKKMEELSGQVVEFDSKIKAAVKIGRDDMATMYIGRLQQSQLDLERTKAQVQQAKLASQQALKTRDNYELNFKKRTEEAMQLISAAKQAKMQEQLAQSMQSFNVGDDASAFDEMRDKINRAVATSEAKLQLGTTSIDSQMLDIEREAAEIQLQDKLLEYKSQMGMLSAGTPPASKQIAANSDVTEAEVLNSQILDETNEKSHSN